MYRFYDRFRFGRNDFVNNQRNAVICVNIEFTLHFDYFIAYNLIFKLIVYGRETYAIQTPVNVLDSNERHRTSGAFGRCAPNRSNYACHSNMHSVCYTIIRPVSVFIFNIIIERRAIKITVRKSVHIFFKRMSADVNAQYLLFL